MRTSIPKLITVFGGSGFVGRYVVRALAKRGYRIRVAVRRPDLAGHLQPLGTVGQIHAIQTNLRYPETIAGAVDGSDHVINLTGILYETRRQTFEAVHHQGARAVADAAKAAGIGLTHMSAIGADAESKSAYARSKAAGEAAVLETIPSATIIRPSIVFGPEDDFFNRFAEMARWSWFLPLVGGGHTKFQPVYVGDVAETIALSVDGKTKPGAVYELGGPLVMDFRECLEEMLKMIDRKRRFITVPWWQARMMAWFLEFMPKPMMTRDQVELLKSDNVVSPEAEKENRTLTGLGISPRSTDAILPRYLWSYRPQGQFTRNKPA